MVSGNFRGITMVSSKVTMADVDDRVSKYGAAAVSSSNDRHFHNRTRERLQGLCSFLSQQGHHARFESAPSRTFQQNGERKQEKKEVPLSAQ